MNVEELLDNLKKAHHIFCYGAGLWGRICCVYLRERGISVEGFVVSGQACEEQVIGKPVYSFEFLPYPCEECTFILSVAEKTQPEIVENLMNVNVSKYYALTKDLIEEMRRENSYQISEAGNTYINVLMYHRVNLLPNYAYQLSASPDVFEAHLKYLKTHYHVIGTADDWTTVQEQSVALTFDDGYADFYQFVFPLLKKYDIPATVFVSTENIDTGKEFFWDTLERLIFQSKVECFRLRQKEHSLRGAEERKEICFQIRNMMLNMRANERETFLEELSEKVRTDTQPREAYRSMSREELKRLADSPLVTIGGHTVTHCSLSAQDADLQKWEIEESKRFLENVIQQELRVFSYPFGHFNSTAIVATKESGYQKAFTVEHGLATARTDSYLIPRNSIGGVHDDEFGQFLRECWYIYQ